MTKPSVPHRFELTVEIPGTPEQVWDAIATAKGISAWMMPTDLEEREGGAVVFHMGEDASSEGTVTGWAPPRRLEYEEPEWAALAEQDPTTVTPLVTEFLVEARSGGTCVVHVVSSAFGSGADWEQEFFDQMEQGWAPMFEHLRLYLTHFPGQRATSLEAGAEILGPPEPAAVAMRRELGVDEIGQSVDARGATGIVEVIGPRHVLLRLTDPVAGLLAFYAFGAGDKSHAGIGGYLFSEDAAKYVEREQPHWQAWLEGVATKAASTR